MKQKILFLIFLISLSLGAYAQKEAYNWTFGNYCGLSWLPGNLRSFTATGLNGTTSTTLENLPGSFTSAISTTEGCFTISNGSGELLFYSDGITIWDGSGTQIHTGLAGDPSSAQSGIVVTYPGASNTYVCIGIDQYNNNNMNYVLVKATDATDATVIDTGDYFSGHSGSLGESMSSIRHANGTDWWIVAPGKGSPFYFNAWLASSLGVQYSSPVITNSGINVPGSATTTVQGYFKFTWDGEHFVWATASSNRLLVFGDFDNNTGEFSNVRSVSVSTYNPYGIEFSPNQKYLYVGLNNGTVLIYDWEALLAGTATTYLKDYTIGSDYMPLQLDYMGRLWSTNYNTQNMFVIDNPDDAPDDLRMYRLTSFLSTGTSSRIGLPSFSASWWNLDVQDIEADPALPVCKGTEITFTANLVSTDLSEVESIEWNFGDGTIIDETSITTTISQTHTYAKRGTYTLTLTPKKSGGEVITESVKTLEVKINSCQLPVNHNISVMEYND